MSRYALDWSFGLISSSGKYLTAEPFQNKIGATGTKLKKKQIFFLEANSEDGTINLRSHTNSYIKVDGDGKFLADGEKGDEENNLIIEAQPDGRWLIKSAKYGWYLGGSGENLSAFISEAQEDRYWKVHLAMHPQITLKNIKRRRYVHLSPANTLTSDNDLPWGPNATVTLRHVDGCYQLQAADGSYLEDTGRLTEDSTSISTQFILDFHGDVVSFKSKKSGKYLTALGATGLLKATKAGITKDEQFIMEDSWPQVTLKAIKAEKYLSIRQGIEVAATQDEPGDGEIFQLEPQDDGTWIFKTSKDKYLALKDGGLNSDGGECSNEPTADNKFTITFGADNKVTIGTSAGLLKQKMNKYIDGSGTDATDDACNFQMDIVNRPTIALRGSFGFIQALESGTLECNKSEPQFFNMTSSGNGYVIEGWTSSDNSISLGAGGELYKIELLPESKMAISFNGGYLQGSQTGEVSFNGASIAANTSWEY